MKKINNKTYIVLGIGIFTYNIFNFYYTNYQGGHYYYNSSTLWLMSIGAMLITLGVIKNKQ